MDAPTIKEARRLLHDLIFQGEAILSSGTMIRPKPDVLIPLIEKIAARKLEETHEPPSVTDYTPPSTYHVKESTDARTEAAGGLDPQSH